MHAMKWCFVRVSAVEFPERSWGPALHGSSIAADASGSTAIEKVRGARDSECGGLAAAFDPFIQVRFFFSDHRGVVMASEHFSVLWQGEDLVLDGLDNGIEVRVGPSGCAGATVE